MFYLNWMWLCFIEGHQQYQLNDETLGFRNIVFSKKMLWHKNKKSGFNAYTVKFMEVLQESLTIYE